MIVGEDCCNQSENFKEVENQLISLKANQSDNKKYKKITNMQKSNLIKDITTKNVSLFQAALKNQINLNSAKFIWQMYRKQHPSHPRKIMVRSQSITVSSLDSFSLEDNHQITKEQQDDGRNIQVCNVKVMQELTTKSKQIEICCQQSLAENDCQQQFVSSIDDNMPELKQTPTEISNNKMEVKEELKTNLQLTIIYLKKLLKNLEKTNEISGEMNE